jgi:hypothetical protein
MMTGCWRSTRWREHIVELAVCGGILIAHQQVAPLLRPGNISKLQGIICFVDDFFKDIVLPPSESVACSPLTSLHGRNR